MIRAALALALALAISGCGLPRTVRGWFEPPEGPFPDLARGVAVVDDGSIVAFQVRAQTFYDRLSRRRFNTYATYADPVLRDYFRTQEAFFDYYAELAHALDGEDFERNRVLLAQVKEFAVDGPGQARVTVRMRGDNGLPMRYWTIVLERDDVWRRIEGRWWLVPGKL